MLRGQRNNQNTIRAGRIEGDPLLGLCYRACIEVDQVFDASIAKTAGQNFQLLLHDFSQNDLIFPYTFVSARNYGEASIANEIVMPQTNDRACFTYDLKVPILVWFTDARGVQASARSELVIHKDIILRVPRNTIVPYRLSSPVSIVCSSGVFINPTILSASACSVVMSKVIVTTDIVVPSYGHAVFPTTRNCPDGTSLCEDLLNLPLFPEF